MIKLIPIALAAALLAGLSSCGNRAEKKFDVSSYEDTPDTLTHHARYITISERTDGSVLVDIADPWQSGAKTLASYILVHRDSAIPESLPDKAVLLRVPLERAAVYSAVHTSAMNELGAIGSLVAVVDGHFFPPADTVASMIKDGRVTDIGAVASPSVERLAASRPEAVLRSPIQEVASPALPRNMVPVEMVDYMEPSPIGRAFRTPRRSPKSV